MTRKALLSFLCIIAAHPAVAQIDPAPAIRRVALVIGNGAYGADVRNLPSAVEDAKAIRDKLLALKFHVVCDMNVSVAGFDNLLTEFEKELKNADEALVYYAGHGAQADNLNYIFPIGTGPITPANIAEKAINVARLYTVLEESNSRFNLIILDACRDNPLLTDGDTPNGRCAGWECGLAKPIGAPAGTIVAFSTSPDNVAADVGPDGVHSAYTSALLQYMGRPGLPVLDVFMLVRLKVREQIATQVPWENTSQQTPFMFRDPAYLEVQFDRADDDATLTVNDQSVQWTVDEGRNRLVSLKPGANLVRLSAYNQKTRRGAVAGPREGWGYRVAIKPHGQGVQRILEAGESGATDRRSIWKVIEDFGRAILNGGLDLSTWNLTIPEPEPGPGELSVPDHHWGRGFATAALRVDVDDDGGITFPVIDDRVWVDGFSLADPSTTALDAGIAWAVTHEGVEMFDGTLPGALRPIADLRAALVAPHQRALVTDSHQKARDAIANATKHALAEAIAVVRTQELNARGRLVEDIRWCLGKKPQIRTAVVNGDFNAARRAFFELQKHSPDVRNELALISNGELASLVQNIP
jgi:hypothetical protein